MLSEDGDPTPEEILRARQRLAHMRMRATYGAVFSAFMAGFMIGWLVFAR